MATDPQLVTRLLREWRGGNREALEELTPLVYEELLRLAKRCLYSERPDHTLRATALVQEAYMRMMNAEAEWQDRAHFNAVAARMVRRILVEYARANNREKRGGGAARISLDEAVLMSPEATGIVVELDVALDRLAKRDQRKSEIVHPIYFGGLTHEETANALEISTATVRREMRLAKAWLYCELVPNLELQHPG